MRTTKNELIRFTGTLLAAGACAVPSLLQAQPTAHYVPGLEGIKAASLPPPGVYFKDYNFFYYADGLNDATGHKVTAPDAKAFIYAQVPRVIWITDQQLLGGYLGLDALLPFQYTALNFKAGPNTIIDHGTFGIGDFFVEGTWSKHIKQFDFALAYGVFAPTGDSSPTGPSTRAGAGYWTHMLTAGATWYIDADKKWSVSALNRYEFNMEKDDTDITPGQVYTVEGGLSYALRKTMDVGVVGYYQQKVTEDSGTNAREFRDRVSGIGPEITAFCPKFGFNTSLRYLYEFMAESRLQGHTIALTFVKRF
jgi:hypothetical protein